ncbi:hypothetical protein [Kitasatospora sp. NPDC001175]|uniref:hypothetical protein n=1 Tax=Kitasatospora sp. NPDC001175 TaxID=3157103 RepID=UPI003D0044B8
MPPATSRIERQITNLIRCGLDPALLTNATAATISPADLESPYAKVAVFVDGCYWHGCPDHAKEGERSARVRRRDAEVNVGLEARGWLVLRVWEHEEHLAPFIERAQVAIVERAAARRAEVLTHLAAHGTGEWCMECDQWPHGPVTGDDGWCVRCDVNASDHQFSAVELRFFGPRGEGDFVD